MGFLSRWECRECSFTPRLLGPQIWGPQFLCGLQLPTLRVSVLRRSLSSAPSRRGETRREELRAPVSWAFLPQALRDSSCGPQSVPFLLNSSLDHISYVTSIFFLVFFFCLFNYLPRSARVFNFPIHVRPKSCSR